MTSPVRLALVGDRLPGSSSHARIPELLTALRSGTGLSLDAYWLPTDDHGPLGDLTGFDGVWVLGSPYRDERGAVLGARAARRQRIPFLGTCGGFQLAVVEFAEALAGLTEPEVLTPLGCSLDGQRCVVRVEPGSLLHRAVGREQTTERYHCTYGLSPVHLDTLRAHGLRFTGHDSDGAVRAAELSGHPFWLGTLFQPELAGDGVGVHPVVSAWVTAAAAHATGRRTTATDGPTGLGGR